ncbi:MAG: ParM/StbA family protein [Ruminococcus sp.]|nr:ParM/StbA family protein [Ruminococcus sp.]
MKDLYIDGKLVIGVDHGYGNMKTRNTVFKSGVKKYSEDPAIATNVLQLDGMYYVIGESHKVFIANKNADDDYYILTLVAVAKELELRGLRSADVILAVGLPLHWMSKQKDSFRDYLMRSGEVSYRYCGQYYHIRICDVAIYPQGYAAIAASLQDYKGVHMLADIGNGTMNSLVITNGRPVSDKKYTDKIGVHECVKKIMNEVQAECGKIPDESVIEDFLISGTSEVSERIQAVMHREAVKYTEMIFDKLSEYEYDPELVKLHIIGGGGCLIRNFGKYDTSRVEIIEDICATAKGYEELYNAQHILRKGA